jgi:hypothetical protein
VVCLTFFYLFHRKPGTSILDTDPYNLITDSDPALLFCGFHGANKKKTFCLGSFSLYYLSRFIYPTSSVFKSLRSHKTVEIKKLSYSFACWWKDPTWIRYK